MPVTLDLMKKPPTETVRIAREMVRRINRIASHQDKSVPQFLGEVLAPIVDRLEAKMVDEIASERNAGTPAEPKPANGGKPPKRTP